MSRAARKPMKITGNVDGRRTVYHMFCVSYVLQVFVISFENMYHILFLLLCYCTKHCVQDVYVLICVYGSSVM